MLVSIINFISIDINEADLNILVLESWFKIILGLVKISLIVDVDEI